MKQTGTILDKIVADKKRRLESQKQKRPLAELQREAAALGESSTPSLFDVLKADKPQPKLIAEAKQASPSAGVLRRSFSLSEINEAYQNAPNVVAISILTEQDHFQGDNEVLAYFAAHNTHQKPLLRKDFIFDPYQVYESKLLGAQAYLLIAALLDDKELSALADLGLKLGMEPLVEVHDEAELEAALKTGARCIGVNSRDLKTFDLDNGRHELLRRLDDAYARVAESGIKDADYLAHVSEFADAALVGGHLMAADDISVAIQSLVTTKRRAS